MPRAKTYPEKISIKLTRDEKTRLEKAVKASPAWFRGLSYYAREALMRWCEEVERFATKPRRATS